MVELTHEQLAEWLALKQKYGANADWAEKVIRLREKRNVARPQVVHLIQQFVSGATGLETFRSTFDLKTRTDWNTFGLKGLSCAMVLNRLVKHIPDQSRTASELRHVVVVPAGEGEGRARMGAFEAFLNGEIKAGRVTRQQIQPARIPFFLSAFWHLQNPEKWPMFFVSARQVFGAKGLYTSEKDVVKDYFAFRAVYLALMVALALDSWDLEQLCWFDGKPPPPLPPPPPEEDEPVEEVESGAQHARAQWLLASLGKAFDCKVWIAANDHKKEWNGQPLGQLSIPTLPNLGMGKESQRLVSLIDVLWLRGANQVVAAFEVEHSTSVYSGLLRMSDLTVLSPNLMFPLYIVAPEERIPKVRRELSRPSLQQLELHRRCGFFSIEALERDAEGMRRWAKDPSAISQLAEKVGDLQSEE